MNLVSIINGTIFVGSMLLKANEVEFENIEEVIICNRLCEIGDL